MIFVVDASVAIKWFVKESLHHESLLLLEDVDSLRAPDFLMVEVSNVAWKKHGRGELRFAQAQAIVDAISCRIPRLQPAIELIAHATDLAFAYSHPIYDCLYLACADDVGGVLITADRELCKTVSGTGFAPLVRHLGSQDFLDAKSQPEGIVFPSLFLPQDKIERLLRTAEVSRRIASVDGAADRPDPSSLLTFPIPLPGGLLQESFSLRRLTALILALSARERADLLALLWLGGEERAAWEDLRSRARRLVASEAAGLIDGSIRNGVLAGDLDRGWAAWRTLSGPGPRQEP